MTPAASPRVLVAEDNPVAQRVAVAMLTELGCQVDAVSTGDAALAAVSHAEYALVLMDCEMPGLDGYEATRRIRATETGRRTPVIALSAHAGPEYRRRSLESGMDDHVVKPFTMAVLVGLLERWTRRAPARPTAAAPVVDESVLAELRSISPRVATATAEQFLATTGRAVAELAAAVRAGDADAVARSAHGIVGSAGIVGAARLQEACRAVEGAARRGQIDPASGAAIEQEHAAAVAALTRSLAADVSGSGGR